MVFILSLERYNYFKEAQGLLHLGIRQSSVSFLDPEGFKSVMPKMTLEMDWGTEGYLSFYKIFS